jgi:PAS domain S-box-containing protein
LLAWLRLGVVRGGSRARGQRARAGVGRYRALFDYAGDAIVVRDAASGRLVDVNRQACLLTGRTRAALLAMAGDELHPPAEAPGLARAIALAADHPGRTFAGLHLLHADGRRIPVELSVAAAADRDGGVVICSFRDLRLRVRDEAALHASDERYRATFEQASVGMAHTDLDGRFLLLNERFCAILGYRAEELQQLTYHAVTHPDDLPAQEEGLRQLLRGACASYRMEKRYLPRGGGVTWVALTVSLLRTPAGEPWQFLSVIEDISERKRHETLARELNALLEQRVAERTRELMRANLQLQAEVVERQRAERQLRESEEQYRTLVEHLLQGVLIMQQDRLAFANRAVADLTGYSVAELLELPPSSLLDLVHPEDRTQTRARIQERLRGAGPPGPIQLRVTHRDGAVHWVTLVMGPIRYGGAPALLAACVDVTALKEAERALRHSRDQLNEANAELVQALRLKDEFLSSVSHELRTPLNNIMGRAEAIQAQIYGPVTALQLRALEAIDASGKQLLALINDILDLSQLQAGQVALTLAPVDAAELCAAALARVEPLARARRLAVSLSVDPDVAAISCDERRARQLLANLLSNAVKFTPEGGRIGLELRGDRATGVVRLVVWDTGIGIAREHLPLLFRPFVQLDGGLARPYEGSGVGLALVARLARLHGGGVSVESAPGLGSRFTVTLPWAGE